MRRFGEYYMNELSKCESNIFSKEWSEKYELMMKYFDMAITSKDENSRETCRKLQTFYDNMIKVMRSKKEKISNEEMIMIRNKSSADASDILKRLTNRKNSDDSD
jgi:alcohol dehydrogenase YqhD (iron-dependent ADH family)